MPQISYRAFCSDCDQIAQTGDRERLQAIATAQRHETLNPEHRTTVERCEVVWEGQN